MAGGFGALPRELVEGLSFTMKKKNMTQEARRAYWRYHFAERLKERYRYEDLDDEIHGFCQSLIKDDLAELVSDGSTQVYKVNLGIKLLEAVYCNFDKREQYVTSCLPPESFE